MSRLRRACPRLLASSAALLLSLTPARAQDRREVREPSAPPVCTTLPARLVPQGGTLAPADEPKLDTARIQAALDACPAGQSVELAVDGSKTAFLTGPIELRRGVTLIVAAGATLYASRDPRLYDVSPGSCGVVTKSGGRGCKPLIAALDVDDAGIMGEGVIDGRGGAPLLGRTVSWWDLAQQAKAADASQQCPRLIQTDRSDRFTLYRITLKNAANFHVVFARGDGFTAWGVVIDTPKTARNTDGIDPNAATNVTIAHCVIRTGDDHIAIKAGSGPASHMTIAHNRFYSGHGMSIGSETNAGVHAIRVTDLTIDGADNGLRIKSNSTRGGRVQDVVYEEVCIRDAKNPVVMDTSYAFTGAPQALVPVYTGIVLRRVRVAGAGKVVLRGHDGGHRLGIRFDNVRFDSAPTAVTARQAAVTFGPGAVNLRVSGPGVTVDDRSSPGRPLDCAGRFAPMPTGEVAIRGLDTVRREW